jgi:hypothetical protein
MMQKIGFSSVFSDPSVANFGQCGMKTFYSARILSHRKMRFLTHWGLFLALALLLFGVGTVHSQSRSARTSATISLTAVDLEGKPLYSFLTGQFIRLDAAATLKNLSDKASVKIGLTAGFTTKIFGKKVTYSVKLPLSGEAGSRIDPSVGLPTSGAPLGEDLQNGTYREVIDFQIPPEMPSGVLTITVTATATSAAPLKQSFSFPVVRN